jgi:uncharacterized membrane protein YbhN (UPF0104 family)
MKTHRAAQSNAAHECAAVGAGRLRTIHQKILRRRWPLVRRLLTIVVVVFVGALIVVRARAIHWQEVFESLRNYRAMTLLTAAALTLASQFFYSCFDLVGRAYTRHHLSWRRVLAIAYVSYAFNLNLGAWIGAIAMRYRLYSRAGLGNARITRILGLAWTTNWLGYLSLAGIVFSIGAVPAGWPTPPGPAGLRIAGGLMLMAAAAYVSLCGLSPRRSWRVHGHPIQLPSLRMALMQLTLAACHWLLMSTVIFVLLGNAADFPAVLTVLLISAVAVVIVHIPAGLGVIEAVFLTLLSGAVAEARLLAALMAYRAIFYLLPMLLGGMIYLALEARAHQRQSVRPQAPE